MTRRNLQVHRDAEDALLADAQHLPAMAQIDAEHAAQDLPSMPSIPTEAQLPDRRWLAAKATLESAMSGALQDTAEPLPASGVVAGIATKSLMARALSLLARREYSRAELAQRLLRHALADTAAKAAQEGAVFEHVSEDQVMDAVHAVLDNLQAQRLLSDERAAQAVVRQNSSRYGQAKVRMALQAKGIDANLSAPLLQELRETEFERALQVWRRKFANAGSVAAESSGRSAQEHAKEKARQMRFLLGRGFSSSVAYQVLRHTQD